MNLLDDDDSGDATEYEIVEIAVRKAEDLMRTRSEQARKDGWKLIAHYQPALKVWRKTNGGYVADYPHGRIEL